ncbi:hypothetical protein EIP73_01635 [Xylella fastidiosa subsp. pauca]|nr:hypothetical protein EIP73_01635 [Xylella fastidiosa subsp. pauca]
MHPHNNDNRSPCVHPCNTPLPTPNDPIFSDTLRNLIYWNVRNGYNRTSRSAHASNCSRCTIPDLKHRTARV